MSLNVIIKWVKRDACCDVKIKCSTCELLWVYDVLSEGDCHYNGLSTQPSCAQVAAHTGNITLLSGHVGAGGV